MKRINLYKLLIVACFFFASVSSLLTAKEPVEETAKRIKTHIMFLADDKLEGREPGTAGNQMAYEYIAGLFAKSKINPFGTSYYQYFDIKTGVKYSDQDEMLFERVTKRTGIDKTPKETRKIEMTAGKDWKIIGMSADGIINKSDVYFVGYGVSSTSLDYDDYFGIDVKGKVVVVLADSIKEGKNKHFLSEYSDIKYKITNARDHGAKAVILVKTLNYSNDSFFPLKTDQFYKNNDIIVVQASRESINQFLTREYDLKVIEKEIIKHKHPKSFKLPNALVSFYIKKEDLTASVPNVIGYINGTDPKLCGEYIVIGAHFDHLGWGGENSLYKGSVPMIHNGADDNASGSAGLLELVERLSKNPLKRPVIFTAFNGEEKGLLGSAYFVKNSPVPLKNIAAMFNFDMIGRMKNNDLSVFGTGTAKSFPAVIDSFAVVDHLKVTKGTDGFAPSDQASFVAENIPVLMFFTGLHADYHSPTDDWDKINFTGEAEVLNYAEDLIRAIDNSNKRPDFVKDTVTQNAKQMSMNSGNGAWFGIIPNFEENPKGMPISGASAGSPAQKAGLQNGDVITKIDNKIMKNLYDLTYFLRDHKPGDKIQVHFLRNGKEMSTNVVLSKKSHNK